MNRREDRERRQALDNGDPDDIVLIVIGHSGTQCADSYHALDCSASPVDPRDIPADADLYQIREMFDWGNLRPKQRGFVLRSTKQPAACNFFDDDDRMLVCPECDARRHTIDRLTNHYHVEHLDADGLGPTSLNEHKRVNSPTCTVRPRDD